MCYITFCSSCATLPSLSQRPFSRQTWLGSARNFARTRFKRFRKFDFSTPKQNFRRGNFGRKILFFADFAWILTSYGETDVKIIILDQGMITFGPVKFDFRATATLLVKNGYFMNFHWTWTWLPALA